MQDAKTETKDYSGREDERRGQQVFGRRGLGCQARCVDRSLYRRPSAIARSLARAKDCGVVICSSKRTTHRPGEYPLCCLVGAATEVQYLISLQPCHEASRGPMAAAHSLLTHAERMHAASLPEHFSCIIIVPRNKTSFKIDLPGGDALALTTDLAPRRHVLASTAHTNTRPPSHHHPTLPCPLVYAGPNPESLRPRTTSTSRSLAFY